MFVPTAAFSVECRPRSQHPRSFDKHAWGNPCAHSRNDTIHKKRSRPPLRFNRVGPKPPGRSKGGVSGKTNVQCAPTTERQQRRTEKRAVFRPECGPTEAAGGIVLETCQRRGAACPAEGKNLSKSMQQIIRSEFGVVRHHFTFLRCPLPLRQSVWDVQDTVLVEDMHRRLMLLRNLRVPRFREEVLRRH